MSFYQTINKHNGLFEKTHVQWFSTDQLKRRNLTNFIRQHYIELINSVIKNEKFIICLSFFLLSFWINWNKELFSFISTAIIIYIIVLFFVFLSTSYDFYFQLDSAAARVVKTLNFSLAFFALYNLNEKIKNF